MPNIQSTCTFTISEQQDNNPANALTFCESVYLDHDNTIKNEGCELPVRSSEVFRIYIDDTNQCTCEFQFKNTYGVYMPFETLCATEFGTSISQVGYEQCSCAFPDGTPKIMNSSLRETFTVSTKLLTKEFEFYVKAFLVSRHKRVRYISKVDSDVIVNKFRDVVLVGNNYKRTNTEKGYFLTFTFAYTNKFYTV